jgi:ribonucleotide monophosphatase NagD (HAD superfamily)
MQRNSWWPTAAGPAMDAGGYVAALEYAAEAQATVVGKPSPEIFRAALGLVGARPADAVMVGDDLVSDLEPAAAVGLRTCLVRTGKGSSFQPAPGAVDFDAPDLAQFVARLLA